MPRRRQKDKGRARTSSQSSVEIQVTEDETVITATTTKSLPHRSTTSVSHASTNDQTLFLPECDFLNLLKDVGARGRTSPKGEMFTFKQLGYFLKEYIKSRQLYDVTNPAVVHCENDPLGRVFGMSSFTFYDANSLLRKHALEVDNTLISIKSVSPPHISKPGIVDHRQAEQNDAVSSTVIDNVTETLSCHRDKEKHQNKTQDSRPAPAAAGSAAGSAEKVQAEIELAPPCSAASPETEAGTSQTHGANRSHTGRHGIKRKRQHRESVSSDGRASSRIERRAEDERPARRRSPSISLVVDEWSPLGGSSYEFWQYVMPLIPSSDDSEILSVQDKETVIVKSSTDDGFDTDNDELELVYGTIDPPFPLEYDVWSNEDSNSKKSSDDDHSDTTEVLEEVYIVCRESDVEFWADSESSDSESDFSSDADLADEDKWECEKCKTENSPLRRYCDRCMELRPNWVPPALPHGRCDRSRKADIDTCSSSGEDECDAPPQLQDRRDGSWATSLPSTPALSGTSRTTPVTRIDKRPNELDLIRETPPTRTTMSSQDSGLGSEALVETETPPLRKNSTDVLGQEANTLCKVCFTNPKDASIIHGNTGHQVCCYRCAKKLRRRGKTCPVCRRKIQRVVRNFIV